ncbi:MAG: (Di)nucleoside polyphosphate hydrolase [uncultured bacterium]|nr:MAG: (Di)nucleoside polyphosphate hydrolase [uncultured bacterium]
METKGTDKPFRKGAVTIVIDENSNFLIVQKNNYKDNEWVFLGGGREDNETLEQNIYRELKEEIGAEENEFELVGVSAHKIEYDYPEDTVMKIHNGKYRGQSYDQVVLRFLGDKSKLVFTPLEFKKHNWVQGKDLQTYLVFPNQYENNIKAIKELLPDVID